MPDSGSNLLLDALSEESRGLILARAKPVVLPLKTVLYRPDEMPQHAYFMTSGVVSVMALSEDGDSVEVLMIGSEGLVGSLYLLGPSAGHTQCFVQSEGSALRIPLPELRRIFRSSEEIRDRILEFVQVQTFILGQIAACHRLHTAEQRLARWLLMVRDRVQSDPLSLTQEFVAEMLGSRRTTVTLVAGGLQRNRLIEYSRGRVSILNSELLEAASCRCYQIIKKINRNLYSDPLFADGAM
ncbi:MAG TPA: Crp/Fnr family transcriptional regulator [Acidobacteriaceae bacterium]|nr:Crp/Fnr family transcriptional regulator [Acidobacteriaceae bacterium]